MLHFWLWFHSLFDRFFNNEAQAKRKKIRQMFCELAGIPVEEWEVYLNKDQPCFAVKWQLSNWQAPQTIEVKFVRYGECCDGMEVFCYVFKHRGITVLRGGFKMDFHPFNWGPTGDEMKTCCYVDLLTDYLESQSVIAKKIKELRKKQKLRQKTGKWVDEGGWDHFPKSTKIATIN